MKYIYQAVVLLLVAALLAGFGAQPVNTGSGAAPYSMQASKHVVQFSMDQPAFMLKQWKADGSHIALVKGKLLIDNLPVEQGILNTSRNNKQIVTGKDGSFELAIDQSLLANTKVYVASLDKATVSGKRPSENMANELLAASAAVSVSYPIRVIKVENSPQDTSKVMVYGQVMAGKGDDVSYFRVDKYRIGGVVKDADGRPVQSAVVWIDRDQGEGFGKSTPTDKDGRYSIFYWPEDEETNLSVMLGTRRYTLPEGKVFIMPEHTSVEIDITLPRKNTVIDDKPPSLVSQTSPGAMYTGVLVGLNVPKNVPYSVTIPEKDGKFVLTVSKEIWGQKPAFFETKLSKFVEGRLTWGDTLPYTFMEPTAEDPKILPSS